MTGSQQHPSARTVCGMRGDGIRMNRTEIRVITSAKGGVGKSTVTIGLGVAFARTGKRVLLVDCDTANRSLDLMLGVADYALFGLCDVLSGTRDVYRTVLSVPGYEDNLFLLPAGTGGDPITDRTAFSALIRALADSDTEEPSTDKPHFDHILIDTPGGITDVFCAASAPAEEALIVSSAQESAVRSAEKTASLLSDVGILRKKLIINAYRSGRCLIKENTRHARKRDRIKASAALIRIVDTVALPLVGVIPFCDNVWETDFFAEGEPSNGHLSPYTDRSAFAHAFTNIAARLSHYNVPLFSGGGRN